jgi:hypothetical protein
VSISPVDLVVWEMCHSHPVLPLAAMFFVILVILLIFGMFSSR